MEKTVKRDSAHSTRIRMLPRRLAALTPPPDLSAKGGPIALRSLKSGGGVTDALQPRRETCVTMLSAHRPVSSQTQIVPPAAKCPAFPAIPRPTDTSDFARQNKSN